MISISRIIILWSNLSYNFYVKFTCFSLWLNFILLGLHSYDPMVVGFTSTYAISGCCYLWPWVSLGDLYLVQFLVIYLISSIFLWKITLECCRIKIKIKSKMEVSKGVDGFRYFSLIFSYFIFSPESSPSFSRTYRFSVSLVSSPNKTWLSQKKLWKKCIRPE